MPGCEPGGKGSTPFGYPGCSSSEEQHYTSVLLGEPAASKTALRGSTPRARAYFADVARLRRRRFCKPVNAGANPVVGSLCPDGVADLHWTLRRSRPWFKSRSGYSDK